MEMIEVVPSDNAPEFPTAGDPVVRSSPPSGFPSAATPIGQGGGTSTGAQPPSGPQPTGSAREALQPGYRDPRLYVAPRPLQNIDQTDHERYTEHLQARIDAVNDSMGVESRRNATTSDWTVTDGSGNRWGLSPDGLHLGGVTIPRALLPLPGATGDNASLGEARERQRQRDEIQRQEEDRERARTERERIEAIEERRE
jgi:hypothetical protein